MASLGSLQGGFYSICGEEMDLRSSCTQRSCIDLLNLVFLLFYCLNLLAASLTRRYSNEYRRGDWVSAAVSICGAATSIAYLGVGVMALFSNSQGFMVWEKALVFVSRGLVWIGLAVSLNIQPTKFPRILLLIWWVSFSLLATALDVKILVKEHSLPVLDIISWPVSLLLLFCTIRLIVTDHVYQNSSSNCSSEPLLIKKVSEKKV